MSTVIVYDINDNAIDNLTQWDRDIYIQLKEENLITQAYDVHFYNQKSSNSLVVESTFADGVLKVKVPNDLLTMPYPIMGYVYISDDNGSRSCCSFRINVRQKPQPSDYSYQESDDYIKITTIIDECANYASEARDYASQTESDHDEVMEFKENMNSATSMAYQRAQEAASATTRAENIVAQIEALTAGFNSVVDDVTGQMYVFGVENGVAYIDDGIEN